MVSLTTDQIVERYTELMEMVETHLEGETLEGVKSIISHFESRLFQLNKENNE